ncbi:molybdopterin molybdenumtransferase MoeA, partial [Streptomyces sp. NPDC059233]
MTPTDADHALDQALALVSRSAPDHGPGPGPGGPGGSGHRATPWPAAREAAVRAGHGARAR